MAQNGVTGHYLVADPTRLVAIGADGPGVLVTVLEDEPQHRAELASFAMRGTGLADSPECTLCTMPSAVACACA
jgi:hypothetical protein